VSTLTPFGFATAGQIRFGRGRMGEAPRHAAALGSRVLVVTGASAGRAGPLLADLAAQGMPTQRFAINHEPTVADALAGVEAARAFNADLIIAVGGGSVIDMGKAVAALLTNPGDPLDYLEVVGRGQPLTMASAPCIAIPTTAGAGAEVTRNAVLKVVTERVKVSLRSPTMLPALVIVDPALTDSLPPAITASTGLDALTQVMEPFVSHQANPLTDGFCREGLTRAARSLRRAVEDGADTAARDDMALASLLGGLALANARLGAVHGFAGPMGGMYDIPHGIICARLLPFVMATNVAALRTRQPDSPALDRYDEIGRLVTGDPDADAQAGVAWVETLCVALGVPRFGVFGVQAADFPIIVEKAQRASSMQGNPLPLTDDELTQILSDAC
jgi:alcohol dehydrogenase class IV